MADLSNIIHILPTMKSGDDLFSALKILPEYDESIRTADVPVRLMALSDLYRIYVPSQMSLEIRLKEKCKKSQNSTRAPVNCRFRRKIL